MFWEQEEAKHFHSNCKKLNISIDVWKETGIILSLNMADETSSLLTKENGKSEFEDNEALENHEGLIYYDSFPSAHTPDFPVSPIERRLNC